MTDVLQILEALQDTPVPNLLVIAGFIFLLLAFIGRFGTYVEVPERRQKWAGSLGLLLLVFGIGLFLVPAFRSDPPPIVSSPTPETPTVTRITPTNTTVPTDSPTALLPTTETSAPKLSTVYSLPGSFHLGDEEFAEFTDWPPLEGECLTRIFQLNGALEVLYLEVEARRTEVQIPIYLNGSEVATLPPQGQRFADHWSRETVSIPVDKLMIGNNEISICTEILQENPDFPGDMDDFQLRNIILTGG